MSNGDAPILYSKDDTGEYKEYAAPTFRDSLPEDIREHEHLKGFENLETLARGHVDFKSSIPTKPETAEAYEFQPPEGMELNADEIKEYKSLAFEMNLSQENAAKLIEFDSARLKKAYEGIEVSGTKARQEAETKLKEDWGDKYDTNVDVAKRAIEKFGGQPLRDFLNESRLGDQPEIVQFCHAVGKALGESTLPPETSPGKEPKVDAYGRPILDFPSMDK